jgi:hypothetical protein
MGSENASCKCRRRRKGSGHSLNHEADTPFESIEGAQEYLRLLSAAVLETRQQVEADTLVQPGMETQRRLEALRLVLYKLEQLEKHVKTSRRILNDLRTLRRLLLEERVGTAGTPVINEKDAVIARSTAQP